MEWFAQLQPIPASSAPQPDHQELFPSVPEADTSQHDLHAVVDSLQEQATVHNRWTQISSSQWFVSVLK